VYGAIKIIQHDMLFESLSPLATQKFSAVSSAEQDVNNQPGGREIDRSAPNPHRLPPLFFMDTDLLKITIYRFLGS
jgi:hypothetical protein